MISDAVGGRWKVIGSSMAMVATGPMPGSTPISVPTMQPIKAVEQVLEGEGDAEAEGEIVEEFHLTTLRCTMEMFIPRPILKTTVHTIASTTMLPITSVSLNSSPPSEAIVTSTTSAGSRPARSNSRAKQTMPMVTMVIGFHFGLSTGSPPLTSATMAITAPSAIMISASMRGT